MRGGVELTFDAYCFGGIGRGCECEGFDGAGLVCMGCLGGNFGGG